MHAAPTKNSEGMRERSNEELLAHAAFLLTAGAAMPSAMRPITQGRIRSGGRGQGARMREGLGVEMETLRYVGRHGDLAKLSTYATATSSDGGSSRCPRRALARHQVAVAAAFLSSPSLGSNRRRSWGAHAWRQPSRWRRTPAPAPRPQPDQAPASTRSFNTALVSLRIYSVDGQSSHDRRVPRARRSNPPAGRCSIPTSMRLLATGPHVCEPRAEAVAEVGAKVHLSCFDRRRRDQLIKARNGRLHDR